MIVVLRLGHRKVRDARLSTHCGLVARAFSADRIVYSGEKDSKLLESVKKVTKNWGGPFKVSYVKNWRKFISEFKGIKVHLTMYGLPLQKKIREVRKEKNLLIIIGGEKVPGEVYKNVDYNIAITSQPHSEVAALALFLHEYFGGKQLNRKFKNTRFKIKPSIRDKIVSKKH